MKKHILESRIAALEAMSNERDRRYDDVAVEKEKAMNFAREAMNYRLAGMNEFRESLRDQSSHFLTVKEHLLYIDKMDEKLKPVLTYITQQSGGPRAITTQMLIGWAGTIILILAFWFAYGNHMMNTATAPVSIIQPIK